MKSALILSVILAAACFVAFLLGARAQTSLHFLSVTGDVRANGLAVSAVLEEAKTHSDYSVHILMGTIPLFGILIGQLYRLNRNQKSKNED